MDATLKQYVIERGQIKASLTRLKSFYEASSETATIASLEARLEKNVGLIDKFESIQIRIEDLVVNTDEAASHFAERDEFENTYYELIGTIRRHIAKANAREFAPHSQIVHNAHVFAPSPIASESRQSAKLPRITLQNFDGGYENWVNFRESFTSLVHNNEALSDLEKFQYLKSSLSGKAARAVKGLGLSETNYHNAWQTLKKKYEDPNFLIDYHVKAFYEMPALTRESSELLEEFSDNLNNHLLALQALGEPVDQWSTLLLRIVISKLDSRTKREWDRRAATISRKHTFDDIQEFLAHHCRFLESSASNVSYASPRTLKPIGSTSRIKPLHTTSLATRVHDTCALCNQPHALFNCPEFKNLTPADRAHRAKALHVCLNCLNLGHGVTDCPRGSCKVCGKKHNTLLHVQKPHSDGRSTASGTNSLSDAVRNTVVSPSIVSTKSQSYAASSRDNELNVMLLTAIVHVTDSHGKKHDCRILMDSGSQGNFMTNSFRKKLNLPCTPIKASVSGIGLLAQTINGRTRVTMTSKYNGFTVPVPCLVIPKISDNIPNSPIDASTVPIPKKHYLADPQFYRPRGVDMLIGNGLFWDLICIGQHRMGIGSPVLQKTQLGWVLGGRLELSGPDPRQGIVCHHSNIKQLEETVERFWAVEHVSPYAEGSNADDACENHFLATTTRDPTGRYVVSIPFTDDLSKLGDSRQMAERRFLALERKLQRQPKLREEYINFMRDYEDLGHMVEVTGEPHQKTLSKYYLPHHAVVKEDSTTTKLRVVFDGSAQTTTNLSLNDVQRVGPTVQEDLFIILLRFRQHRYVISADIAKMYRQILVRQDQRRYQRILWRSDSSCPIKSYELTTVTYGTASAPFLATRALKRLAEEHQQTSPEASKVITNDFYVDDLLTGAATIEEAKQLRREVTRILSTAGFQLRKWASNDETIIADCDEGQQQLQMNKDPKTLGLLWSAKEDTLRFVPSQSEGTVITKRMILSEIAKLFDPLGLIGPVIVRAKIILQQLWQLHISWDESLPQETFTQWTEFRKELLDLPDITVPRPTNIEQAKFIEVHGFCDASEKAYGACLYMRSMDNIGNCQVRLLCAKSRVAPLKVLSLPRLELCGATLLARLADRVKTSLHIEEDNLHFWCDSTITLAWIRAPAKRWKTFVANRVAEVQRITNRNWRHVASTDNPADLISRGTTPAVLRAKGLWWNGPAWLQGDKSAWPCQQEPRNDDLPEARIIACPGTIQLHSDMYHRYSSSLKLIRVIAYCLRFFERTRAAAKKQSSSNNANSAVTDGQEGTLSAKEQLNARIRLLRIAQHESFQREVHLISRGQEVFNESKLRCLNPFMSSEGLLRVGGRLANARIPYDQQHPVILCPKHPFTVLLVRHEHQRLLHAGCQNVLASLRRQYWILSGRSVVKRVIRDCIRCFRSKPTSPTYAMGNLPAKRVTPARPFSICGVDYAGPIFIKERSRIRTAIKAYLCIFVCFVTKAVHLEVATDLTTDAFLNCLRRFISRRGRCHSIHSDNGSNFIGARNELNELGILLRSRSHQTRVKEFLATERMEWHLIPPHAPHFGGLWESAVKSTKFHLKRVIGETRLTYEELYTLFTQIEACLNSRPLCPLTDDPTDPVPLTPGHFLIGDALTALPQSDLRNVRENRLNRYQLLQQKFQHFWQRWYKEYLHQLQQRHKWNHTTTSELTPGALVVLREDNLPPLRWRLGRITETHPGADKVVRVVSVKVSEGIIKRPVTKICLLPMPRENPISEDPLPSTK